MSLKTLDFPIETAAYEERSALSADEVEQVVRTTGAILTADGDVQVAALHYVDPQRFGDSLAAQAITASYGVKIVPENVSVSSRTLGEVMAFAYAEDIIPFTEGRDITEALANSGYAGDDAVGMAGAIARMLHASILKEGTVLRLGLEVRGDIATIVRTSVYDRTTHVLTIALDDDRRYVPGLRA